MQIRKPVPLDGNRMASAAVWLAKAAAATDVVLVGPLVDDSEMGQGRIVAFASTTDVATLALIPLQSFSQRIDFQDELRRRFGEVLAFSSNVDLASAAIKRWPESRRLRIFADEQGAI